MNCKRLRMGLWLPLMAIAATPVDVLAERDLAGFDCLIEPHAVVDISVREEGVLEEILADRGDLVEEGQPLVKLDSEVEAATVELALARTELDAELQEQRENLALARRELARINELFKNKAVSFTEKDRATTERARAGLQLRQIEQRKKVAMLEWQRAQKVLSRRTVKSPIAGVVVERNLSPGESVENETIMRLAAIDPLNVEVIIPVEHYGFIEVGMLAEVTPRFPGAEMRHARVTIVDRVVDAASDTFGVRLELANPENKIPGGVRCDVRFVAEN